MFKHFKILLLTVIYSLLLFIYIVYNNNSHNSIVQTLHQEIHDQSAANTKTMKSYENSVQLLCVNNKTLLRKLDEMSQLLTNPSKLNSVKPKSSLELSYEIYLKSWRDKDFMLIKLPNVCKERRTKPVYDFFTGGEIKQFDNDCGWVPNKDYNVYSRLKQDELINYKGIGALKWFLKNLNQTDTFKWFLDTGTLLGIALYGTPGLPWHPDLDVFTSSLRDLGKKICKAGLTCPKLNKHAYDFYYNSNFHIDIFDSNTRGALGGKWGNKIFMKYREMHKRHLNNICFLDYANLKIPVLKYESMIERFKLKYTGLNELVNKNRYHHKAGKKDNKIFSEKGFEIRILYTGNKLNLMETLSIVKNRTENVFIYKNIITSGVSGISMRNLTSDLQVPVNLQIDKEKTFIQSLLNQNLAEMISEPANINVFMITSDYNTKRGERISYEISYKETYGASNIIYNNFDCVPPNNLPFKRGVILIDGLK